MIKTRQPGVFADGQCRAKVYAVVSQDINVNISDFLSPKKGKRSKINNDFLSCIIFLEIIKVYIVKHC